MTVYVPPGKPGSVVTVKPRYGNFIGGEWREPTTGKYSVDLHPGTAKPITEVPKSAPEDVDLALDAAHAAQPAWGEKSLAERAEGAAGGPSVAPAHGQRGGEQGAEDDGGQGAG